MNYLLDTHTFIWTLTDNDKLSKNALQILENTDNDVFVSAVTFWEISLKTSIGKLSIEGVLPDKLPDLALQTGFLLIPLSPTESASFHNLNFQAHTDPFDRMLIRQAISNNFTLISKDQNIKQYQAAGLKYLW